VDILGHVPDLAPLYAKARLAVAPLRFGAGLKGKVLEAWAHGLPCVLTPIAAEGLPRDPLLSATVGNQAADFARLIVALHEDERQNAKLGTAARRLIRQNFSQKQADAALAAAIAPPGLYQGPLGLTLSQGALPRRRTRAFSAQTPDKGATLRTL
jgi:glycosyltransferase involved in cell wall biosynthesis